MQILRQIIFFMYGFLGILFDTYKLCNDRAGAEENFIFRRTQHVGADEIC